MKIQISLRKKSSFIAKDKLDNKDQNNQNDDIEKDDKSTLLVWLFCEHWAFINHKHELISH